MISVGIIGGTGYTGKYLIQFINRHPEVEEMQIYANTTAGHTLHEIMPEFEGIVSNKTIKPAGNISYDHDVYFVTLPHGKSLEIVPALIEKEKKVIDLGGDFRLNEAELYNKWYGFDHTSSNLLNQKHYGLADLYKAFEKSFIANPGCYPTASLLALIPLTRNYGQSIASINVSSYSGASGAGKSLKQHLLLSELYSNVQAYNVGTHRHEPEISQELALNGFSGAFDFVTHLLPISTGIYSTAIIQLNESINADELKQKYYEEYSAKEFVRIRNSQPELKWVVGTNFCDINITVKDNSVIITSTIDNLIKGASGQAIQNMNQMFGWEESMGITADNELKNKNVFLV
jgi:N-acetyl-gamma-glutamyl-phosphate reductase